MPGTLPRQGLDDLQLSERDAEVLRVIGEEELMSFTFEGLRRRLGTHSETLSRTLHRLEQQMVLEKTAEGYHVTEKGKQVVDISPISVSPSATPSHQRLAILHTLLPFGQRSDEIVSALKGRWFGPLRWLGYSQDQRGTVMKWVTDDGSVQIDAIFSQGQLTIEGNIREGKSLTDAIKASYQLVGYLSRINPPPLRSGVAFYSLDPAALERN